MRKIIIISISILFCFIILFGLYLKQKEDIYYAENSLLYQYCQDYYYANNGNFSYEKFLKIIENKDKKLYSFLKEKKCSFALDKGFIFVRSKKSKSLIKNSDYTFFKFLFSNNNILIEEINYKFYDINSIYRYENNIFVKRKKFDIDILTKKYADFINCKKIKYIGEDDLYNEKSKSIKIVINQGKITFFHSEFDKESEAIIRKALEETYRSKDTIMVNLRFYNIKEAKCLDEL
ncbi:hypothetical protein [Capnocytophaga stomatis]|uniref:hypothetical protein n=1 Tax=Capnocytophaga stomatis TaxID=1848904 RepID=UPI001AC74ACC|nr:hypothetical protein [Capnocytophaga stomatis]GIM50954.1 hypothetical protein CAPN003_24060 [Capnocytophaga stomatis]